MNVGIILYSFSGNTLSVAERLKETLSAAGHAVTLEQIETVRPGTLAAESGELRTKPAIDAYDGLVFGTPVRGGMPSLPMVNYLEQIPSLEGKKVALLVTGFFPVAGWGREQTIAQLRRSVNQRVRRSTARRAWAGLAWAANDRSPRLWIV